jgi:hypothetical protein
MALVERRTDRERFNWKLPLYSVVGATSVMLWLLVYADDPALTYLFLIIPIGCLFCLFCLILFVVGALRNKPSRSLSMLLAAVAFLVVSGALLSTQGVLRPSLRWLLWSHRYKSELLAQQAPANGHLKHIEWESSGWGPVGPTIVYLVFDPADSLSAAAKSHRPGKFSGLPCEVPRVQRLESGWYAVTFYTEESWGQRNCSGSGS